MLKDLGLQRTSATNVLKRLHTPSFAFTKLSKKEGTWRNTANMQCKLEEQEETSQAFFSLFLNLFSCGQPGIILGFSLSDAERYSLFFPFLFFSRVFLIIVNSSIPKRIIHYPKTYNLTQ